MIEVRNLGKRYGDRVAVHDLTFTVRPGTVTGFLGPNGAGKSTTMRMIVGLDAPTSGTVRVNGRRYADHPAPMQQIGALLEAKAVHSGRSAYHHLRAIAATTGIPRRRVDEVIDLVGLHEVARRRAGSFSLGMGQRLGIATALLGDPDTVVLDEPVNGLDPEGVLWIRNLLKALAAEGRTIFVSSHLMSEMALTAEHLIVVGRGRLIADVPTAEFTCLAGADSVRVRSPQAAMLAEILAGPDITICSSERGVLEVTGLTAEQVGALAARAGLTLYELSPQQASLEEVFMELTRDCVEYQSTARVAGAGDASTATEQRTIMDSQILVGRAA
jgi:ABC-2 type transport system ATP-binding protein